MCEVAPLCVVTQMLGAPFTLLGLLHSDLFTGLESISEDFSALSPSLESERPRFFRLFSKFRSVLQLPLLLTSVFRPPPTSSSRHHRFDAHAA